MSTPEKQLFAEQSRQDRATRVRRRLIAGLWILALAVSMVGWLVALYASGEGRLALKEAAAKT